MAMTAWRMRCSSSSALKPKYKYMQNCWDILLSVILWMVELVATNFDWYSVHRQSSLNPWYYLHKKLGIEKSTQRSTMSFSTLLFSWCFVWGIIRQ